MPLAHDGGELALVDGGEVEERDVLLAAVVPREGALRQLVVRTERRGVARVAQQLGAVDVVPGEQRARVLFVLENQVILVLSRNCFVFSKNFALTKQSY